MHGVTPRESGGELLPQDEVLLRALQPARVVKKFALGAAAFSLMFAGVEFWDSGSWSEALSPRALTMGSIVAVVVGAFGIWKDRRLLRRTSGETRDQLQRDWRFFTSDGWVLKIIGAGVGMAAYFVILALGLTAFSEPIERGPGFWTEVLSMLGVTSGVLVAAMLLFRSVFLRGIREGVLDPPSNRE